MASPTDTEEFIRQLAQIITDQDLSEIEVEREDMRIRLARTIVTAPVSVAPSMPVQVPAAAVQSESTSSNASPAPEADLSQHPGAVTSPMVGTAYTSPDPNAPSFVQLGDMVSEGQTLLIIEAMKVMNPIKAHKAGRVAQILFQNAQPVEFGEVLLVIE